jgi:hypothetical protein
MRESIGADGDVKTGVIKHSSRRDLEPLGEQVEVDDHRL